MHKYLIGSKEMELEESNIAIVTATDKQAAITKYIREVELHNEFVLENIYSRAINAGCLEEFIDDTMFDEKLELKCTEAEYDEKLNNNINTFFKEHKDWSDLYIDYINNYNGIWEYGDELIFPADMMYYMYVNMSNYNEDDYFYCEPLDSIPNY